MHMAKKRLISFFLAIVLFVCAAVTGTPGTVTAFADSGNDAIDALMLGSSLGMSALGVSAQAARFSNTITIVLDGNKNIQEQIDETIPGMTTVEKQTITTVRIEVHSGQTLTGTRPLISLNHDLRNLMRLEIEFEQISDSVIPQNGFYGATWIRELESNAEIVEASAFHSCDGLRSVHLEQVIDIKEKAFHAKDASYNNVMDELYIPNCQTLGQAVFQRWYGFQNMTIDDLSMASGSYTETSFDAEANFYQTRLTTNGYAASFHSTYPRWLFQSVNDILYFHDQEVFRGNGAVKNLGSLETGQDVDLHMERDDGTVVSFSLADGDLPPGLTLNASGRITGTPTQSGEYKFRLELSPSGEPSYQQDCIIQVGGDDLTKPEVRKVTPATNQFNVPTDGTIEIVFSEPMDPGHDGIVELLWNSGRNSMLLPNQNYSWSDNNTVLTVSYSNLTPGQLYWIYIRNFRSSNWMYMDSVEAGRGDYYFTTAALAEQPQATPGARYIDAGETAEFELSMGAGADKADRAVIVNYDGLTFLSPSANTDITSDCTIRVTTDRHGVYSFRVNFYKTGETQPQWVSTCYISVTKYFSISVAADPADWGTVTGATDKAPSSQEHVVTAIPAEGYRFDRWSENGTTVSHNSSYYFYPNADRNLVAHFTHLRTPYEVMVQAVPQQGGTVTGMAQVYEGDIHTVTAQPAYDYYFVGWTEFEQVVSTDPEYTFTVDGDRYLTARFSPIPHFHVEVTANPPEGGTVTGTANVAENTEHTVTAVANRLYRFVGWTEGDQTVSTDTEYTFTVTGDRSLTANFTRLSSGGSGGGSDYSGTSYSNRTGAASSISFTGLATGPIRVGDSFTLIPDPDTNRGRNGWTWDEAYFSATFNSPATFTALKPGTSTITYTTWTGVSGSVEVTILAEGQAEEQAEGQVQPAEIAGAHNNPVTGDGSAPGPGIVAMLASLGVAVLLFRRRYGMRG